MIGTRILLDNTLSKQLLGLTYETYSFKQTIVEMGYSLIKQGLVPDLLPK